MAIWEWPNSRITKVVDGDTIDAVVSRDLGFGGTASFPVRLRLNRINAPRVSTKAGKAARDRAIALLAPFPTVRLLTIKPYKYGGPEDVNGEWMAEVFLGDGRNLSDALVAGGHAVAWDGTGERPEDG